MKELTADPFQFIADAAKSGYVNEVKRPEVHCFLDADTYAKAE
jgi:hypothetical protein